MSDHESELKAYQLRLDTKRASWSNGPWDKEQDREEFEHLGFPCLISRGTLGPLCGYVGVHPGHPWHGKKYDDVNANAHGGLTYSAKCSGHICHAPKPGEPEDVWWLGFDCAHLYDEVPARPEYRLFSHESTYRDFHYVRREVLSLAEQAAEAQ